MPVIKDMTKADKLLSQFRSDAKKSDDHSGGSFIEMKLTLELLTPQYGGGVQAGELDEQARPSGIKGQIRYWWRLLKQQSQHGIFGAAVNEKEGGRSNVLLRCSKWKKFSKSNIAKASKSQKRNGLSYGLDVLSNDDAPLRTQGQFTLTVKLSREMLSEEQRQEVSEALAWWLAFGGIGARTRRGFGQLKVIKQENDHDAPRLTDPVAYLLSQKPRVADCADDQFELFLFANGDKSSQSALQALNEGLDRYREFRQDLNKGIRSPYGRSKWPEPDAIRTLGGTSHPEHRPEHKAGEVFPRAAFGLPLLTKFKDSDVKHGDPQQTVAMASVQGQQDMSERMASPMIFTCIKRRERWVCALLFLPAGHVRNELSGIGFKERKYDHKSLPVWPWANPVRAMELIQTIPPLHKMNLKNPDVKDPLAAFAQFFVEGGRSK
jgi:CRISPR-associated protein Cmr1